GSFTPEGPYPLVNGLGDFYNLYYNHYCPLPFIPVPPQITSVAPVFVPAFAFQGFFYNDLTDSFERPWFHFYEDGYDGQLQNIGLAEATSEETAVPRWRIEEILDGGLGGRRDLTLEEELDEEQVRRLNRSQQKVGWANLEYFVFDPETSRYSSYRIFGVPRSLLEPIDERKNKRGE
ncbi:MAG: hypothetical protein AAF226_17285, partial [Verrucomicrobiota bacterium]